MAMSEEQVKIFNPSPVMVTPPYEWKIIDWDDNPPPPQKKPRQTYKTKLLVWSATSKNSLYLTPCPLSVVYKKKPAKHKFKEILYNYWTSFDEVFIMIHRPLIFDIDQSQRLS